MKVSRLLWSMLLCLVLAACGGGGSSSGGGKSSTEEKNSAPNASAGADISVDSGASFDLEGSGSDPDGDDLSYAWEQVSGTAATIETSSTSIAVTGDATVIAPETKEDLQLSFQLTVSDGNGGEDTDTVTVNVNGINLAPSANAGEDLLTDGLENSVADRFGR